MKERMHLEKEKENENKGWIPKYSRKESTLNKTKKIRKGRKKKQESTEIAKEKEQNAKDRDK